MESKTENYRFQLASDIHIEKQYPRLLSIRDFITPVSPNLILAGDIGSIYYTDQLEYFFKTCKEFFECVIFVPGNNEYYSREKYEPLSFSELNRRLEKMCEAQGIILLNNAFVETDDLVIFGSTWWSYIPDQLNMRIKIDQHQITADEFNYLHYLARISLSNVLTSRSNKRILVITHYCPTKMGTMNSHHKKDDFLQLVPYYFSNSESFLKQGTIHTWVYGHTHVFRDFIFDRSESCTHTRIISNADPRKKFFRPAFTFDV